jgi:chlorite dismutase
VELGLYESSRKTYEAASAKGFEAFSADWNAEIAASLERASEAMKLRLFPSVPEAKYLCFYPMDRKRGETANWYTVPFAERQRMMHEHGMIGRRYAEQVKQIISGSIGMDDWEWGVDLFADDPVVFKKLIYEMRFDEVSAVYALFGQFFIGVRLPVEKLGAWLEGKLAPAP